MARRVDNTQTDRQTNIASLQAHYSQIPPAPIGYKGIRLAQWEKGVDPLLSSPFPDVVHPNCDCRELLQTILGLREDCSPIPEGEVYHTPVYGRMIRGIARRNRVALMEYYLGE